MANVRKYLQDILDAIYGEEVRGSVHDAIEAMNEESTNAEAVAISSRDSAKHSAEAASLSETNAKASETAAKASENAAKASKTAAKTSETNAKASENAAKASESAARTYSMQAFEYKHDAQESAEAAHEYEQQCEQIRDDIGYPIDPKGTVTFANLPSLSTAQIGWLYNISNDFTTTSDFEEGAGKFYSAGTEVYVNSNHKWSAMAGPGVTGIKGEAESTYHKGQINITRAMLGIHATNTPYTNTTSGLSATNVQSAIDELDAETIRSRGQCTETNANTIIKPGVYWCNPSVTANLPSTQRGMLEVVNTSKSNGMYPLTQKYTVVPELGTKYYFRTYRYVEPSYVWSDWQIYESANKIYAYNGIMGAKNLFTFPYYTKTTTVNGITYTVNDDATITVNGTATADSVFTIANYRAYNGNVTPWNKIVETSSGKFRLTGCPSGGSLNTYYLQCNGGAEGHTTWWGGGIDTGNGLTFDANIDGNKFYIYVCRIVVNEGCVCDNLVFKPMLRDANDVDETFRPYAMTNKKLTDGLNNTHGNYYGTCATSASTAAKVVTVDEDFKLAVGTTVTVKFTNTNTASNPTINVNGTGAKSIWYSASPVTTLSLSAVGTAGRYTKYMYDGTYWVWMGWSIDNFIGTPQGYGFGYGTCANAESTVAKVVTLSNYVLTNGGYVSVKFTNGVPANATMNINSKGAKPIYYQGSAIKAGIIEAGDVATFIYNGSQYVLTSIDKGTGGSKAHYYATKEDMLADIDNIEEGDVAYTGEDASDLLTRVEHIEQDVSDAQDDIEQINSDLSATSWNVGDRFSIDNIYSLGCNTYESACSFFIPISKPINGNSVTATFNEMYVRSQYGLGTIDLSKVTSNDAQIINGGVAINMTFSYLPFVATQIPMMFAFRGNILVS